MSARLATVLLFASLCTVAGADVIPMQTDGIALDGLELAAEPIAALMRDRHVDLHQMAGIAFEIGAAHKRAVDPG